MPNTSPILEVRFYVTPQHREPAPREWLKALPQEARKTIGEDLKTVQFGWPLGMPLVRKMDTRLWEARSRTRAGTARVLFTLQGSTMMLLHGFIKTTVDTPRDELRLALHRASEIHAWQPHTANTSAARLTTSWPKTAHSRKPRHAR